MKRHKFAMLFPGQGSQHLGMCADLAREYPIVQNLFAQAAEILGYDLWQLTQQGPQNQLDQTIYTQPAMLVADVATFHCWQAEGGPMPDFMAGHSLGEYAALVCTESLRFEDAVALVAKRAAYMQEAVPVGKGAMGAIIGLDPEAIETICKEVSTKMKQAVTPANFNAIGQTVVAGQADAVQDALKQAQAAGAKIAKLIPVSVPAHCALMQPAADRLSRDLAQISFHAALVPVLHNTDVETHDADNLPKVLAHQLVSPVRWVETIEKLVQQSVFLFLECGPDNKLAGLSKRISNQAKTLPLNTRENICAAISSLKIMEAL